MLLFRGLLHRKKVLVFSTSDEARDYCKTHRQWDFNYRASTVYIVYRARN